MSISVMKKRSNFETARTGEFVRKGAMMIQARARGDGDEQIRVGFTCSKKVGNAVERNAAKRRLREAARIVLPETANSGWDYVLIGKRSVTETLPFTDLVDQLRSAIITAHASVNTDLRPDF